MQLYLRWVHSSLEKLMIVELVGRNGNLSVVGGVCLAGELYCVV
jgi:hypothetical protein